MASVFTKIIRGELPARFVWKDEHCVAFLSIHPLRPGHTLVVPREEIDHWLDLPQPLLAHLTVVSQKIGRGLQKAFRPTKVGLMLAGLEVPHVHFHVVPIDSVYDLDFARQDLHPKPEDLDRAADQIRRALQELGFTEVAS
ncbi:MAG: HIT family protein [Candidatus Binatia bacterium]|nr:MAG: HIT family protein [Candidatus Binatia bacterium]